MSVSLSGLVPALRPHANRLLQAASDLGFRTIRVSSVRRTAGVQRKLYRDYLAGRSRYPAAPPGHSMHERGRAFDLVGPDEQLAVLGRLWQSWGGTWGAKFGDPIHFEA